MNVKSCWTEEPFACVKGEEARASHVAGERGCTRIEYDGLLLVHFFGRQGYVRSVPLSKVRHLCVDDGEFASKPAEKSAARDAQRDIARDAKRS